MGDFSQIKDPFTKNKGALKSGGMFGEVEINQNKGISLGVGKSFEYFSPSLSFQLIY